MLGKLLGGLLATGWHHLLAELSKAGTDTLRVLQELVSALIDASFFFAGDALGGEIGDTVVETTLNQVAIQSKEILHLLHGVSTKRTWSKLKVIVGMC